MPKIDIKYKDKKQEYEVHASGWFIGSISFNNKPQIKKLIKEYGNDDD